MHLTADQHLLKDINRMGIVRQLSAWPGQSRAALAEALQLTKSTVSALTKELIAEGWLLEREVVATGELGRRPTPLFVDPRRLVLLGAELGVDGVSAVATSLTGQVLARARSPLDADRDPHLALVRAAKLLVQLHARLDAATQRVIGIGIGLPGGVDEPRGHLHFAPNLGWRDLPAGGLLAEHLRATALQGVPLFVQNDADAAALGELEFASSDRLTDPLIYLSLGVGVGASIVVEDRLLTGARGLAGEVGHMTLQLDGPRCSCGRRGCAEALIGFRAMLDEPVGGSLRDVQQRLRSQPARSLEAIANAGRHLGLLLNNLCAAYDPGRIILGGPAIEIGAPFLDPAYRTLAELAADGKVALPQVSLSRFGADAVPIGAAALARYRLTRPLIAASRLAVAA